MREIILTVGEVGDGLTALEFLRREGFSHRVMSSLKATGGLTRGGAILRTSDRLARGDEIRAVFEETGACTAAPNPDIAVEAVYEDPDTVVFDKPPYLPVHPSMRHYGDTLANVFAARWEGMIFRPVNRLDKNTSGLCVCAKNKLAAGKLSASLKKIYYAAVDGDIACEGEISLPIGREEQSVIKRRVRPDGKTAVTRYRPVLRANGRTLLEISLGTGRTHQIRVHLSHIGFPLCGDELYGGSLLGIQRQALHCGEVSFAQPVTGETVRLTSRLPEDIVRLFSQT